MKNAIILASHSLKLSQGTKELIQALVPDQEGSYKIFTAGGTENGHTGTSPIIVLNAYTKAQEAGCDYIYVFYDMGSAKMAAETALDFVNSAELKAKIKIIDQAAFVEGAYVAAVQSTIQSNPEELVAEVLQATNY
ncbi:hypothetical protein AWM75_04490 [Aerococcus urinaehominis]|uniref:phosphoenolpyruvate--glycerone phosphotransferase n=1 Tax=Aerococcus urinaehominis TaxID=128944 RepID=A0A0X8FL52_9LACT|nr:dihydroxyacetone kinase phosphoryl donor subunit DhaM [Aerococcus urinaehominis]AMB99305.1 hypothetical protein AWM75_04490 [Aerococcus urinaehominis]SDM19641.1 dihydroxyacetone kinase, phosphotransfer subunit [Aerococcus urinaehominis]